VSARPTPSALRRAKDAVQVVHECGAVSEAELAAALDCGFDELRAAIGIAIRWRRIDRCAGYLVAVTSAGERRRAA
jgi:hypothetical protein